jgi:uncharacterized protein (AIM24 family)
VIGYPATSMRPRTRTGRRSGGTPITAVPFGGEGLFFATLTGPGRVWLQSLPLSRLAGRILMAGMRQTDQGSVLGGLGMGE